MINLYYKIISVKNNIIIRLLLKFYVLLNKKRIKDLILHENDEIIFVYDLRISSVAFGDYFYCIYFLKFLNFKKIQFIIIDDYIRDNFRYKFNNSQKIKRINEFHEILKFLFNEKSSKIIFKCLKWKKFIKDYYKNDKIILKNIVFKEKPIYQITHNIICHLFNDLPSKIKNKYNLKNLKSSIPLILKKKYIAVGFRIGYKNELSRNFDINKINKLLKYLYNKHKCKILIMSDKSGITKIKKNISYKNYVLFSKDYTNNFIEDGNLILNSLKYYQYTASGISVFAEHSKISYELYIDFDSHLGLLAPIRSNYHFSFNKKKNRIFYPWTKKNQFIFNIKNFKFNK